MHGVNIAKVQKASSKSVEVDFVAVRWLVLVLLARFARFISAKSHQIRWMT